jgi:hypothetical protein
MENENIIPFRSSMVACERSLLLLTKGLVSGRIDRKARFFTFIMKNLKK